MSKFKDQLIDPPQPPRRVLSTGCKAIRYGDELACPRCSTRWGVDEDAPDCTPRAEIGAHVLKDLKNLLS